MATYVIGDVHNSLIKLDEMSDVSDDIILMKCQNPHYVFTKNQYDNLRDMGITTCWIESLSASIDEAKKRKRPIVILGTTAVVSEVKQLLINEK